MREMIGQAGEIHKALEARSNPPPAITVQGVHKLLRAILLGKSGAGPIPRAARNPSVAPALLSDYT